ncbi:phage tail protein [Roseivirga sp. BDSF3-8]|uniref:phage tail protein n=1 Tax=Roseivirga sp. BDSF3-8 TaxID=3241598 RepID=UPI0035325C5C
MDDAFIGMVVPWAPNFAPRNWAFCHGQLLAISSNTALFSLIGTTYGGDGRTTFALPDLRGRAIVGQGDGPGLSMRPLGQKGGLENVTLNITEIPSHTHSSVTTGLQANIGVSSQPADEVTPSNGMVLAAANSIEGVDVNAYKSGVAPDVSLAGGTVSGQVTIGSTGGNLSHNNMQPYTVLNYIICMYGIFPPRS